MLQACSMGVELFRLGHKSENERTWRSYRLVRLSQGENLTLVVLGTS
jgi:hypothetical protein